MQKNPVEEMTQIARGLAKCPIHLQNVLLSLPTRKSGQTVYTCPDKTCPVFCFENGLRDYCDIIANKLLPIYKCFTPLCHCSRPSTLRISSSKRNPHRPYFGCRKHQGCNFFQWGDKTLSEKNCELEEKKQMQKAAKEQVLYKLGDRLNVR